MCADRAQERSLGGGTYRRLAVVVVAGGLVAIGALGWLHLGLDKSGARGTPNEPAEVTVDEASVPQTSLMAIDSRGRTVADGPAGAAKPDQFDQAMAYLLDCRLSGDDESTSRLTEALEGRDASRAALVLASHDTISECALAWLRRSFDPVLIRSVGDQSLGELVELSGCDYGSIIAHAANLSKEERAQLLVRCLSVADCLPDSRVSDILYREVMAGATRPEHVSILIDHLTRLGWAEVREPTGLGRLAFLPVACEWDPVLWTAAADRLAVTPTNRVHARQFMVLMLAVATRGGDEGAEQALRGFVEEALRRPQWEFHGTLIDEALLSSEMARDHADQDAMSQAFGAWSDVSLALSRVGDALSHDPSYLDTVIGLCRHPSKQMRELCLRWIVGKRKNPACASCDVFVTQTALFDPELGPATVRAMGEAEPAEEAEKVFVSIENDPRLPGQVRDAILHWRSEGPHR